MWVGGEWERVMGKYDQDALYKYMYLWNYERIKNYNCFFTKVQIIYSNILTFRNQYPKKLCVHKDSYVFLITVTNKKL